MIWLGRLFVAPFSCHSLVQDQNIQTTAAQIVKKSHMDIHDPQTINPNVFGDAGTFPVAPT